MHSDYHIGRSSKRQEVVARIYGAMREGNYTFMLTALNLTYRIRDRQSHGPDKTTYRVQDDVDLIIAARRVRHILCG